MILDVCEIPVRVAAAPAVVNVGDGEAPTVSGRELGGSKEKRCRVRTPGHGEENGSAARQEAGFGRVDEGFLDRVHS